MCYAHISVETRCVKFWMLVIFHRVIHPITLPDKVMVSTEHSPVHFSEIYKEIQ